MDARPEGGRGEHAGQGRVPIIAGPKLAPTNGMSCGARRALGDPERFVGLALRLCPGQANIIQQFR